jgi:hypothetical protein
MSHCTRTFLPTLLMPIMLAGVTPLSLLAQTNCGSFNVAFGPFPTTLTGNVQHVNGAHVFENTTAGACNYTGTALVGQTAQCSVTATATSTSTVGDLGTLLTGYSHPMNSADKTGTTSANSGSAAADAEGVGEAQSCYLLCGTAISITITGEGNGGGFSYTFSPTQPLWSGSHYYKASCAAESLPPLSAPVCTPTTPSEPAEGDECQYWDTTSCSWQWAPCGEGGGSSPIIVDTTGKGFHFTDPAKGEYVTFDIQGNGTYEKLSWPRAGSGNAWLVLDRDGDGIIKDGTELFGNFTQHSNADIPNYPNPNGFLALEWYDKAAQGGNMDLMISDQDAIWPKLKLWIDTHCYLTPDAPCQSLPDELFSLDSKGVRSISLVYGAGPKTDAVGNQFKFFAVLNPLAHDIPKGDPRWADALASGHDLHQESHDGRLTYDVFLKSVP